MILCKNGIVTFLFSFFVVSCAVQTRHDGEKIDKIGVEGSAVNALFSMSPEEMEDFYEDTTDGEDNIILSESEMAEALNDWGSLRKQSKAKQSKAKQR